MRTAATGKKAIKAAADEKVTSGNTVLTLNPYNKKKAWNSTGLMKDIAKTTVEDVQNIKTAALIDAMGTEAIDISTLHAKEMMDTAKLDLLNEEVEHALGRMHNERQGEMGVREHQRQESVMLRHAFDDADEDGSGTLDHDEIAALVISLGAELSEKQTHDAIQDLDGDGDGMIGFDEFQKYWAGYAPEHTGGAFTR